MLPFEDRVRKKIEEAFPDDLALCRDLLRFALDLLGCDSTGNLQIPSTPVPDVSNRARSLALGLYTKACKLFRSIMLLGEAGFAEELNILARSLFETALALEFILKPQVTLTCSGKAINVDPSKPLTSDFRALLYWSGVAFAEERRFKVFSDDPELLPYVTRFFDPVTTATDAESARCALGPLWSNYLKKNKRGLAGLSAKDLAISLGVGPYYAMVYGPQSDIAHAGDAFAHFVPPDGQSNGSLALAPTSDGMGGLLYLASRLFLGCLASIHNRLQFGPEAELRIGEFEKRLNMAAIE
jgi:hypothetical protein